MKMNILPYAQSVLLLTQLDLVLGCSTTNINAASTRTIRSPNYPSVHNDNDCRIWIITGLAGKYVGLTFTGFTLESCCDFVEVRTGQSSSSPLIGKFSGSSLPPVKYSSLSGSLYVKFTSDGSVQYKGFIATIEAVFSGDFNPIVGHPLACTFDSGICGWTQSTSDNFDWTLYSGSTPPVNTSPSADHTTGTGAYIYMVSSFSGQRHRAKLVYSSFTGNVCLRYFFHMYGSSLSRLNVYVGGTLVRQESGNKGNNWMLGQVQIQGFHVKVELEGVRGSGYTGDIIALDDFVVLKKCIPEFSRIPQQMTGFSGAILSPNYPNNYGNYRRCVWRITVPSGKAVSLTFSSFNLQSDVDSYCSTDFIELRNGPNDVSPILGKFCGSSVPSTMVAYSGSMLVTFVSDGSNSFRGFYATYTAFDQTICKGVPLLMRSSSGSITSPGYPHNIKRNWRCIWRVTAPSGMCVRLVFSAFRVQFHDSCNWEFVEIRDGAQSQSRVIGKFCGTSLPPPQYACSGAMQITFSSDGAPGFYGFKSTYNAISVPGRPYLLQRSSTNLTISWSWNSQLQAQFLIYVQPVKTISWTTVSCVGSLSLTDCVVKNQPLVVTDLMPYRAYRFRICSKVLGMWSKVNVTSVEFWTRMAAPSQSPLNVSAHSTSPSSLMVLWEPIPADFVNGILLGYYVIYLPYATSSSQAGQVSNANGTKLELAGLQKHTTYKVQVLGFTAAGNGTASQAIYVKTDAEEPPTISNISDSNVASWTGHHVSLCCYAIGHSPIHYSWTKHGHVINRGVVAKTKDSVLIVTPLSEEDFGTYTCTATNRDGSARHNVTLMQIENPVVPVLRGHNTLGKSTESKGATWITILSVFLSSFSLILVVVIVFLCRRLKMKDRNIPDQVYDNVSMRNFDSGQRHGDIPENNTELQYDVVNLYSLQSGSRYTDLPAVTNQTCVHSLANSSSSPIKTDTSAAAKTKKRVQGRCEAEQHYQTLQVSTLDNLYGQLGTRGRRVEQKVDGLDDEIYDNEA